MFNKKYTNLTIFFSILLINTFTIFFPLQEEGFLDSDELGAEILRGFGVNSYSDITLHTVPRLTSEDSHIDLQSESSSPQTISSKYSEYFVPGWADTRFGFRKNITISSSKIPTDLVNFPMLIDLYDSDLHQDAQASGNDIYFTDASGLKLNHEIENYNRVYNSTHARLVAWVKCNLSSSQDSIISMYYGNSIASNQENSINVWDRSFVGVWHLNEDPTGIIYDSTSYNRDCTSYGSMTSTDQVAGQIGGSLDFDGSDDYVQWFSVINQTTGSYSMWISPRSVAGERNYIADNAYRRRISLWDDVVKIETDTDAEYFEFDQSSIKVNEWQYVVFVRAGDIGDVYVNGSWVQQVTVSGADFLTVSCIGGTEQNTRMVDGIIDEVRISNVTRSADWIAIEYDNQMDPTSFYSVGLEENSSIVNWSYNIFRYRKDITLNSSQVAGNLTNFPVMIDLYDSDLRDSSKVQVTGADILFVGEEKWIWTDELLTNGDFETGNLNGWTTSGNWGVGSDPTYGDKGPQSGSFCAYITTNGLTSDYIQQDVDISSYASDIVTGKALASVSGWSVMAEDTYDETIIRFQYLDTSKAIISTILDTGTQMPNTWTEFSLLNDQIPINARYIRVWARCHEVGWDAGSVDSFSVKIATLTQQSSGVKLDHEIEIFDNDFNSTHAHLIAWVKVPKLSNTINTTITMYYGNPTITSQENPRDVWDSDYKGVWHLEESGTGSTGEFIDSTSNDNDGQSGGGTPGYVPAQVTGKIGYAQVFDGIDDYIDFGNDASLNITEAITVEAWVQLNEDLPPQWGSGIVIKANQYELFQDWDANRRFTFTVETPTQNWASVTDKQLDTWYHVVGTYDGSNLKIFLDGTEISSIPTSGLISSSTNNLEIGRGEQPFDGLVDEVRISNVVRSTDWILTEYHNQFNPNSFYKISFEEINQKWWVDRSFNKRRDIVIDHNKVSGDLTDFPVLIKISDTSFELGSVQPDGSDILFADSNGSKLNHEIESFTQNSTHGNLIAWVKIPTLLADQDTIISMYFSNPHISSQENPSNVWDSNYVGVWHMNQDPSGPSPQIEDSSSPYFSDGTSYGSMSSADLIEGKVGNAIQFDGSNDYINIGSPSELEITGALTIETWIRADFVGNDYLISKNGISGQRGWEISFDDDPGIEPDGWVMFRYSIDGTTMRSIGYERINTSEWYHLVGVFSPSTYARFYLNGQLVGENTTVTPASHYDPPNPLRFGTRADNPSYYNGTLDEIRISNSVRSTSWISTQYNNQYEPLNFYSIQPEMNLFAEIVIEENVTAGGVSVNQLITPRITGVDGHLYLVSTSTKPYKDTTSVTGLGLTWTELEDQPGGRSQTGISVWYAIGTNTITDNVTVTVAASPVSMVVQVHRFSGVDFANPIGDTESANTNGENGGGSGGTDNLYPTLDIITSSSNTTVFGAIGRRLFSTTPGTGYTLLTDNQAGISGDTSGISTEYKTVPIAGTVVVNATLSSACDWAITGIEIKPKIADILPPILNDFGVDDPGTGTGVFWARITDATKVINSTIKIDGIDYSMSNNGSHWLYQTPVIYGQQYTYEIVNATDVLGNSIKFPTIQQSHTFNFDTIAPTVVDWEYFPSLGAYGTFKANVTDTWGVIDTVMVNVTENAGVPRNDLLATMVNLTATQYMNDTLIMDSGTIYFEIIVNDTAGNSFTSAENSSFVSNQAPTASNLTLSRSLSEIKLPIFSNSTLYLNYTYDDPENDSEQGSEIRWYKNNVLQTAYNDFKEIPASELNRGDEWNTSVQPKDGTSFGEVKYTGTITIKNTPPVIQEVLISPSDPLTSFDLSISNTTIDEDADPIIGYEIRWFINSIYDSTYNDSQVISSTETVKGQNWTCEVRASDGLNYSSWAQSNTVLIRNSAPTATVLNITSNPRTTDDLVANWTYFDVDGDPQNTNWFIQWYKWNGTGWEPEPGLENSTIVGSGNTTKNDQWYYQLQVYDGENYSIIYTLTPSIQILNTQPEATDLTITLTPTTNDSLFANWTYSDVDGDSQSLGWLIRWYKDGNHQAAWDDSDTVPSSATSKGEVWNYTLQVHDGTNYSILYSSPSTTIINTPPTVTELTIPPSPTSSDTLVASWTFADMDSDNPDNYLNVTIIHWYQWNGTGWELQPGLENSTTVDSGNLTKSDLWYYTLQIYDGEAYSIMYSSASTTILNSRPVLPSTPTFNKTQGVTPTDTINITYVYFDVDNDPEDPNKRVILWYVKGVYNSAYDNQTIIYSANTTEGEIWQYEIQVYDNFNYSIEYTSILILIGDAANLPPSVLSHNITVTPLTTDNIIAWYIYNDADGINYTYGSPGTYEIFWYLNGTLQPALNDSLSVSSELTNKHQTWNFTLRVFDGLNWSIQYNSITTTISNTPPQVTLIELTFNPTTSENLTASWTFVDADADSEISYNVSWYNNGVYNSTYANNTCIPATATRKGEIWNYTLQVYDGENYSVLCASVITIIQNTPPTATGVTLTANPTTSDALNATWSYTDVDDDPQNTSWIIHWYKNGFVVPSLDNLTTVGAGNTSKNEYWYYQVQVFDGEEYSRVFFSPNRQILNTIPVIQGQITINPSDPVRGTPLELNYTFYDEDGDFQYGTLVQWYRNGIEQPSYANLQSVPGSVIFKGDLWYAIVKVSDGTDIGLGINSSEVLIENTPPVVTSASVFPASPVYTSNALVANYASFDVDNDFINDTYTKIVWKNGSNPVLALENQTQVPANYTKKNQFWTFEVQIYDGMNWSIAFAATGVIIKNSKPTIANVVLTGGGTTTEDIILSYDFLDLDNDSEDLSPSGTQIEWIIIPSAPTGITDDKTLSSINFVAGDFVFALITPHDGEDEGSAVFSTSFSSGYLFIGNTAPVIVGIPNILGPNQTLSYSAATTLYANYSASDIDGESTEEYYDIEVDSNGLVVGAEYRWYRNGELVSGLTDQAVFPSYLTKGDKWKVSVRPRDRYGAFGAWVNSTEIEIDNSFPQVTSFDWGFAYPNTRTNLSFSYSYFDLDDDPEWFNQTLIQWFKNGFEISFVENQSFLSHFLFQRDDVIYVVIQVFDGKNYSVPYQSSSITIFNTLPEATDFFILPIQAYTTLSLTLTWTYLDADNDSENTNWKVYWYQNGILVPELMNKKVITANNTKKGEIWSATFQVFDGSNYSILYSSGNIIILNSPMILTEITLNDNSSQCYADVSLTINPSQNLLVYDPDQDPLTDYMIYWYKNGVYQTDYDNQTIISTSQLSKGESWYAIVRVFDGDEWSQNKTSRTMLIVNKPPTVTDIQFEFDANTSQIEPDVRETSTYQFYAEDEDITISYLYFDVDTDLQQNRIQWYRKTANSSWLEVSNLENITIIPSSTTLPGESWYYQITPYDGTDQGIPVTSTIIFIESRPIITSYSIVPDPNIEGAYEIIVSVTNERDTIYRVEFETILNENTTSNIVGLNEGTVNWTLLFAIDDYDYLNTVAVINVKATSKVNNTEFIIYSTLTFNFTIEDEAPPRVVSAFFTPNTELNPTNLTFYADVEEFGVGIEEVILYYAFEPFENGGTGATRLQDEPQWLTVPMTFVGQNTTGVYSYSVTVTFEHNQQNMDIIYLISTRDQVGNNNPIAFDIRKFPQRMNEQRIYYQAPGLPSWMLLVAGSLVVLIFMGAVVYVKFIRKPELVGLDKELVMNNLTEISDTEIMEVVDAHTIGIVISFFDQRHGPIPIIVEPEILKDNFSKLVDLSDRSFSGTGFSNDFISEVPSSYDFVLTQNLRISVMSFGFALERPQARGGQENLTLNLLVHQDIFPLVQAFQKQIQRRVHELHLHMDKNPEEKDTIRTDVLLLRKLVTKIVLSYEKLYGTTELIDEEE